MSVDIKISDTAKKLEMLRKHSYKILSTNKILDVGSTNWIIQVLEIKLGNMSDNALKLKNKD